MLLAYVHCFGVEAPAPELCLVPDRSDQGSNLVRVDALLETDCAVCRLSSFESFKVRFDEKDGGMIVEPVIPTKLSLTPTYPDRPGIDVKRVKIIKLGDRRYKTFFMQEGRDGEWRPWNPNEAA
jgi:hypothetical protein